MVLARKYETRERAVVQRKERLISKSPRPKKKVKFGPMISWTVIWCAFLGVFLSYVAIHAAMAKTSYEIEDLRKQKGVLENNNARLNLEIMNLTSLEQIEKTARSRLHMVQPEQVQFIALSGKNGSAFANNQNDDSLKGRLCSLYHNTVDYVAQELH